MARQRMAVGAAALATLFAACAPAAHAEVVTVRLATGLTAAPRISGPPRAWCPRVPKAPVIDGAAWRASPVMAMGTLAGKGRPGAGTEVRAVTDGEHLCVAFTLREPDTGKLRREVTNADGPVWGDDSVELFISPTADRKYYHLGVSAGGGWPYIYDDWDMSARRRGGQGLLGGGGRRALQHDGREGRAPRVAGQLQPHPLRRRWL